MFVLALTVLGPAVAESQILVICGIYRDSYADTEANLCHGSGSGCAECVFIALAKDEGDEPVERPRQSVTVASSTPRLSQWVGEPDQQLSLAVHTGLPFAPPGQSGCNAPPLFDRVRAPRMELVSPVTTDRSRNRVAVEVSAR